VAAAGWARGYNVCVYIGEVTLHAHVPYLHARTRTRIRSNICLGGGGGGEIKWDRERAKQYDRFSPVVLSAALEACVCVCVRGVMWCVVSSLSHAAAARPPNTHQTPRPRSIRPGGHLVSGVDDGVRAPGTHACTTFASRVPPTTTTTTKPLARVRPWPAVRARTAIVRGGLRSRCGPQWRSTLSVRSEEYPNNDCLKVLYFTRTYWYRKLNVSKKTLFCGYSYIKLQTKYYRDISWTTIAAMSIDIVCIACRK